MKKKRSWSKLFRFGKYRLRVFTCVEVRRVDTRIIVVSTGKRGTSRYREGTIEVPVLKDVEKVSY